MLTVFSVDEDNRQYPCKVVPIVPIRRILFTPWLSHGVNNYVENFRAKVFVDNYLALVRTTVTIGVVQSYLFLIDA